MESNLDIIANPKLLEKMTVQGHEYLTYEQQIKRLKQLRQRRRNAPLPHTPLDKIPF